MTFLSEIRTVSTPRPKLPPAPKRAMPKITSLEATLAAMKADAQAWKHRKADAWGEGMAVTDEPVARRKQTVWTPDACEELKCRILGLLRKHGPMTATTILERLPPGHNRHKLRDMLTELGKGGKVRKFQKRHHFWERVE